MFTLFVSHNCGSSYYPETSAETIDELRSRMKELDEQMLRWYLESNDEQIMDDPSNICAIHKGIFDFMNAINEIQTEEKKSK